MMACFDELDCVVILQKFEKINQNVLPILEKRMGGKRPTIFCECPIPDGISREFYKNKEVYFFEEQDDFYRQQIAEIQNEFDARRDAATSE